MVALQRVRIPVVWNSFRTRHFPRALPDSLIVAPPPPPPRDTATGHGSRSGGKDLMR
jgi:hypothetical protein